MPEVQEVFRMATQKIRPDVGALERQLREQRRRSTRRKGAVYALVAALVVGSAIVAASFIPADRSGTPSTRPSPAAPGTVAPIGTVTSDGSTCSVEITAERIEPGVVVFDVVNTGDQRVMFDSWQILEGYTFQEFESVAERQRRLLENGKPYPSRSFFPDQGTEVRYLRSDVIPPSGSGVVALTMSSGTYAVACLQRYEGAHESLRGFQMFGLTGPIHVR